MQNLFADGHILTVRFHLLIEYCDDIFFLPLPPQENLIVLHELNGSTVLGKRYMQMSNFNLSPFYIIITSSACSALFVFHRRFHALHRKSPRKL